MFHRADVDRLEIEPMYRENSLDAFNDQASTNSTFDEFANFIEACELTTMDR